MNFTKTFITVPTYDAYSPDGQRVYRVRFVPGNTGMWRVTVNGRQILKTRDLEAAFSEARVHDLNARFLAQPIVISDLNA